jgi:hypothetical protein
MGRFRPRRRRCSFTDCGKSIGVVDHDALLADQHEARDGIGKAVQAHEEVQSQTAACGWGLSDTLIGTAAVQTESRNRVTRGKLPSRED